MKRWIQRNFEWLLVVVGLTLALGYAVFADANVNCGPTPVTPVNCKPPAVCFCDEDGNCEWRFECD